RPTDGAVAVDLARARQVVAAAHELKKQLKLKGDIDLAFVARQPEVLSTHTDGAGAAAWIDVEPIVAQAAQEVLAMRAREGRALAADLTARLDALEAGAAAVAARAPARLAAEPGRRASPSAWCAHARTWAFPSRRRPALRDGANGTGGRTISSRGRSSSASSRSTSCSSAPSTRESGTAP